MKVEASLEQQTISLFGIYFFDEGGGPTMFLFGIRNLYCVKLCLSVSTKYMEITNFHESSRSEIKFFEECSCKFGIEIVSGMRWCYGNMEK